MARILQALADTNSSEIEAAGFALRVRKIRSSDLAEVGVAALAAIPNAVPNGEAEETEPDLSSVDPKTAKRLAEHQEQIVCAALLAIGDPASGEWDDCKVVLDPARENPERGIVWVGSLPQGVITAVFNEAMRLATDDGEAVRRLANFRERSQPLTAVGSDR